MIIPEFHFFQVKREPFLGDAMELDEPFLGVAPESFNAVDVDLAIAKVPAMVKVDMPVPTEHERIIAFELVRVNNTSTSDHLDRQVKQCLSLDILNGLHMDKSIPLEDAEHGDLIGRPAPAFSFALASEVGLVQFDRPIHPLRGRNTMPDRLPDDLDGFKGRGITQADLLSDPAGRDLQFKELDDPQPLLMADLDTIDPAVAEVMKGVLTSLATVSFTQQPVDFIAVTPAAKNVALFPAEFTQIQPGTVFTFDDELKGF
jgi:hypothetical protein